MLNYFEPTLYIKIYISINILRVPSTVFPFSPFIAFMPLPCICQYVYTYYSSPSFPVPSSSNNLNESLSVCSESVPARTRQQCHLQFTKLYQKVLHNISCFPKLFAEKAWFTCIWTLYISMKKIKKSSEAEVFLRLLPETYRNALLWYFRTFKS